MFSKSSFIARSVILKVRNWKFEFQTDRSTLSGDKNFWENFHKKLFYVWWWGYVTKEILLLRLIYNSEKFTRKKKNHRFHKIRFFVKIHSSSHISHHASFFTELLPLQFAIPSRLSHYTDINYSIHQHGLHATKMKKSPIRLRTPTLPSATNHNRTEARITWINK